jgi:hypothetical protein
LFVATTPTRLTTFAEFEQIPLFFAPGSHLAVDAIFE